MVVLAMISLVSSLSCLFEQGKSVLGVGVAEKEVRSIANRIL